MKSQELWTHLYVYRSLIYIYSPTASHQNLAVYFYLGDEYRRCMFTILPCLTFSADTYKYQYIGFYFSSSSNKLFLSWSLCQDSILALKAKSQHTECLIKHMHIKYWHFETFVASFCSKILPGSIQHLQLYHLPNDICSN